MRTIGLARPCAVATSSKHQYTKAQHHGLLLAGRVSETPTRERYRSTSGPLLELTGTSRTCNWERAFSSSAAKNGEDGLVVSGTAWSPNSAAQVCGPTLPSAFRGCPRRSTCWAWNSFTAAMVSGPKTPLSAGTV